MTARRAASRSPLTDPPLLSTATAACSPAAHHLAPAPGPYFAPVPSPDKSPSQSMVGLSGGLRVVVIMSYP